MLEKVTDFLSCQESCHFSSAVIFPQNPWGGLLNYYSICLLSPVWSYGLPFLQSGRTLFPSTAQEFLMEHTASYTFGFTGSSFSRSEICLANVLLQSSFYRFMEWSAAPEQDSINSHLHSQRLEDEFSLSASMKVRSGHIIESGEPCLTRTQSWS